ncbi:MAG TPA: ABC transporter permease [Beijerinckiaceae bacterium]|jgi:peptide/nickel transport system permease protein
MRARLNLVIGLPLVAALGGMALVALAWTPYGPTATSIRNRLKAPSSQHWLGTDEFGRDVLSRIMDGASVSFRVALATVLVAILAGTLIGVATGYLRGWTDRVVMMVNDALLAFPGVLLALAIMVVLGPGEGSIVAALGLAYTPSVVRIVRGQVLSLREREYVEASRMIGNSDLYTMARHILPNCIAPITVLATSLFGWAVLSESALSFLGLGVPPPAATWGNMLAASRSYMESAAWLSLAPGLCIALTLLGVNLLGDALRDRLDPRMSLR